MHANELWFQLLGWVTQINRDEASMHTAAGNAQLTNCMWFTDLPKPAGLLLSFCRLASLAARINSMWVFEQTY